MKQSTQEAAVVRTPVDDDSTTRPPSGGRRRGRVRPWLVVLTVLVIAWLGMFVVPNYIGLDPDRTPIALLDGSRLHYPVLVVHVAGGLIAMVAGCLQIWPWLRRTRPRVHRVVGRVYLAAVFIGAPAALALVALAIMRDGPRFDTYLNSFAVGNVIWALLWFATAARGLYLVRRRRFADHRRVMIYSFALTLAIMYSRPLLILAITGVVPFWNPPAFFENMGYLPWVFNLIVAQLWLTRTARRPVDLPPSVRPSPAAAPASS